MFNVKIEWKDGDKLRKLIKYLDSDRLYYDAQNGINDVADKTVDNMRETISSNKKRHSFGNNLEKTIDKEVLNDVGGVDIGIGNVNKLKSDAPYYEVLNAGGYIPYSIGGKGFQMVGKAPFGSFEGDKPNSSVVSGNQNWERSGDKGFFMKPKKPIEGIGYIEKAVDFAEQELDKFIEALGGKFIRFMPR